MAECIRRHLRHESACGQKAERYSVDDWTECLLDSLADRVSCRTVTSVFRMLTIIRATREDDLPTIAARGKCRSYFLNNRLKKNAPRLLRADRQVGKWSLIAEAIRIHSPEC